MGDFPESFSLVSGGRSRRALAWAGMAGPDWRQTARSAAFLAVVCWLPLLVLALIQRSGGVFLEDLLAHVRFLVALPLLVAGQQAVEYWAGRMVRYLLRAPLVEEKQAPALRRAAEGLSALRDSGLAELVLLGAAYLRSYTIVNVGPATALSSWRLMTTASGTGLSAAGWWYVLVSLPIFHFILYRWVWGFLVWTVFLCRVARAHPRLVPTHPDRAGGLGFAGAVQARFGIMIFAWSAVLSATIGERALLLKIPVLTAQALIIGFVIASVVVVLAPLLVFTPALIRCRTQGLLEYTEFGEEYAARFHDKWIGKKPPEGEALLGSADIQSLADLGGSFDAIRGMRPVAFDVNAVLVLAASATIPLLPLVFAVTPLASILRKLAGMLF